MKILEQLNDVTALALLVTIAVELAIISNQLSSLLLQH